MDENQQSLNRLLQKLEYLIERQESFSWEINQLKEEIGQLQLDKKIQTPEITHEPIDAKQQDNRPMESVKIHQKRRESKKTTHDQRTLNWKRPLRIREDLEKFIGENLINKIGISITIIGVAIGVKYSIEHELISPMTRIILGYLAGIALLVIGIRLKEKYKNYSAVLVSGAMTILYFITFAAYSFYELIPVAIAFPLMVVFTIFTVMAALSYKNQVIAHIGLVGAYAVPFLLSSDSGNVKVLFSYMTIINIGILILAFKKYWKMLNYASFLLSWIIYIFWFEADFEVSVHFSLALIFALIFFFIFYITFMAFKLIKKEDFIMEDIILLLVNSFVFYAIGYAIFEQQETGEKFLGLFTIGNALIHFAVCIIVFRQQLPDKNLFYLISGLALVFITIAIPVQLDGRWVTLLWVGEAALVFWIGRTKGVVGYEKISYPLMLMAFISLGQDWAVFYNRFIPDGAEANVRPILNIHFLSSVLFIAAFGIISYLFFTKKNSPSGFSNFLWSIIQFSIPTIFLFTLFYSIRLEIANYWNQLFAFTAIETNDVGSDYASSIKNQSLPDFKAVWILNYTMLFFTVLSLITARKLKDVSLGLINLLLNALVLVLFLSHGLYVLSDLREAYLSQFQGEYFDIGKFYLVIRYISYVFVFGLIYSSYALIRKEFMKKDMRMIFNICLHIAIIWILSSELIHWLDVSGSSQAYKLGLSILWGTYSLMLIALGIWKKHKYFRVGAIVLFAITLVKLFLYDVSHLGTISKTVVFVLLGVLLLIISFLYNKYRHIIADEEKV